MGVWNSHTSVGNILGSLIAGYWASTCWGLSFVVPGAIVAAMGIVCFLFLIERKCPRPGRCCGERPGGGPCGGGPCPTCTGARSPRTPPGADAPSAAAFLVTLDFLPYPDF